MTYEEALQSVLMYCSEECGMIDACRCENKECVEAVVIEALEKQIPKKPARARGENCGQAIDWGHDNGC